MAQNVGLVIATGRTGIILYHPVQRKEVQSGRQSTTSNRHIMVQPAVAKAEETKY